MIVIHNNLIPLGKARQSTFRGPVHQEQEPDTKNREPRSHTHPAADRVADPLRDGAPGTDSCLRIILAVALYCADLLPCHPVLHPLGPRMVAAAIRHGIPRHSP